MRITRRKFARAAAGLLCLVAIPELALAAKRDKPFRVVTTFTVIRDIAQNVAGDAAIVESITKPGAEIHDYQPGYTLIGAGVFTSGDVRRPMAKVMPKGTTWLQTSV